MAVQQSAQASGKLARALAWQQTARVLSLAEKLDQQRALDEVRQEAASLRKADRASAPQEEVLKSFSFHLGADIQIPTDNRRATHISETAQELASRKDPFAGLPFQRWAEKMGERVMPAYDLIKEERRKVKLAAKNAPVQPFVAPSVPHLLPFTRWAAASKKFQSTLIAEDAKDRKKARLSWYHPDDTMVPRGWFKGGLLEDIKYYAPFMKSS